MPATRKALAHLQGAFALAIIFAGEDDLMIGARQGSPLAIGHGQGEMYLGSDAIALAPFTSEITYLEEGDWAVLTRKGATIYDRAGKICRAAQREIGGKLTAGRQGQSPPLHGQGNSRAARSHQPHARQLHRLQPGRVSLPDLGVDPAGVSRISISACGTAYYAGLVGKYWFERYARIPVEIDIASEFRYREPPMAEGGLAIFVSQSGETADTLATLRYCKAKGQSIASIVNVRTSTIARESNVILPTLAGPEIGVASTKALTCQLSVLACLAIGLGRARGVLSEAKETGTGAGAGRSAASHLHHSAQRGPLREDWPTPSPRRRTCSIWAAA